MNNKKTAIRFFTIADYAEEEVWLRSRHKNGWKLLRTVPPCFYIFEKCAPEDMVYRLDYKNNAETGNYFQIFRDYGWEYIGQCFGWLYFRKPLSETDSEQDSEIFSDNESRLAMINHVIKTRLLPILIIFLCIVFPNFLRSINTSDPLATTFTAAFSVLTLIYLYLLIHCGLKLRKLRKNIETEMFRS
ncbi:MAG: DUF2812 domain-containing protein [Bacteroidales bacterium]|nr:DUF2812 domain-containing protein [Bacteroidales bacterium]MCM1415170.1 DUF2812 domain-containing protein [bacterium]MCM1423370.1 DUF2812 domain-containing protein [bacterium]